LRARRFSSAAPLTLVLKLGLSLGRMGRIIWFSFLAWISVRFPAAGPAHSRFFEGGPLAQLAEQLTLNQ
jgi:hypothetical protein